MIHKYVLSTKVERISSKIVQFVNIYPVFLVTYQLKLPGTYFIRFTLDEVPNPLDLLII